MSPVLREKKYWSYVENEGLDGTATVVWKAMHSLVFFMHILRRSLLLSDFILETHWQYIFLYILQPFAL